MEGFGLKKKVPKMAKTLNPYLVEGNYQEKLCLLKGSFFIQYKLDDPRCLSLPLRVHLACLLTTVCLFLYMLGLGEAKVYFPEYRRVFGEHK